MTDLIVLRLFSSSNNFFKNFQHSKTWQMKCFPNFRDPSGRTRVVSQNHKLLSNTTRTQSTWKTFHFFPIWKNVRIDEFSRNYDKKLETFAYFWFSKIFHSVLSAFKGRNSFSYYLDKDFFLALRFSHRVWNMRFLKYIFCLDILCYSKRSSYPSKNKVVWMFFFFF